ncbi:MAG: LysR family transcriptional regulator, partial [Phycisphaerales bacterium]|nr:LysR family transcriptional regulator [Phycisphaerales bacterium]
IFGLLAMTRRNITQADLNLLIVLNILLEERNVTRAADRLGLTQSAVSRILGRLRVTLNDPLFVRTGRGLTPTTRALELAVRLREPVAALESILLENAPFVPATALRCFRVAAIDYVQVTLLAPLVQRLTTVAPGIDFEIRHASVEAERDLETGVLDLLIRPQQPSGPRVVWTPLYHERYACLLWNEHPAHRLTIRSFTAMEHVLVAPRERPGGIVDEVLGKKHLSRRVAVQVSTFLLVPYLLAGTQRVATVPQRMAEELARIHPLKLLKPPVDVPGFTMCQAWHEIHDGG